MLREAQAGDSAAVHAFFDEFADPIRRVIRKHLGRQLQPECGESDLMQMTGAELLQCDLANETFASPEAFLKFILKIAERQVQEAARKQTRIKRGGKARKKNLDVLSQREEEQMIDARPQAADVAANEEEWQNVLVKLTPVHRMMAVRLREGYTHAEIAKELGLDERTVRRLVVKLKEMYGIKEKKKG